MYVDHATAFTHIVNQVSLDAPETVRGKHLFEREARSFGVNVKSYRGDNGVFKAKEYQKDLEIHDQTIEFSGVRGHHQNGIVERAIRTITESARAMLLHAAIHWPSETSLDMWPMAMEYAVWIWNQMPREDSGYSPEELFSGVMTDLTELRRAQVWGCPASY